MSHVMRVVCWFMVLMAGITAATHAQNLLTNGDFEDPWTEAGQPPGWHIKITSIIPEPEYEDPINKKGRTGKVNFICGCGHDWGTVRPWTNLVCPQCQRMNIGLEDAGTLYDDNEKYIASVSGRKGKGIGINLVPEVGNNEGIRVISKLIKARRGAGYEISFDARKTGDATLRVFVEGFRLETDDDEAKTWAATLPAEVNPLKLTTRLKRVFRKHINAGGTAEWKRYGEYFVAPQRSQFDYMFVTLYGYLPGEGAFDNVVLRQLSDKERAKFLEENPGPKDERLR